MQCEFLQIYRQGNQFHRVLTRQVMIVSGAFEEGLLAQVMGKWNIIELFLKVRKRTWRLYFERSTFCYVRQHGNRRNLQKRCCQLNSIECSNVGFKDRRKELACVDSACAAQVLPWLLNPAVICTAVSIRAPLFYFIEDLRDSGRRLRLPPLPFFVLAIRQRWLSALHVAVLRQAMSARRTLLDFAEAPPR